MTTRVVRREAEKREVEKEMLVGVLMDLLRDEENRYCVDCDAKGPRWASWNLGIFVCIRCAGIHRKLGVHISKVKSVNLDSWTAEQVQSMRVMGNCTARGVYECHLPEHFRRPQSDQSLESFIRAKYEHKRYIMKDWVKPPVDAADLPIYDELQELWKHGTVRVKPAAAKSSTATARPHAASGIKSTASNLPQPPKTAVNNNNNDAKHANANTAKKSAINDLVDLSAADQAKNAQAKPANSNVDDLLGLGGGGTGNGMHTVASAPQINSGNGLEDLFGDFASAQNLSASVHVDQNQAGVADFGAFGGAPAAAAAATPAAPQPAAAAAASVMAAPKSNQDIMALFASAPSAKPQQQPQPQHGMPQQQQQQMPGQFGSFGGHPMPGVQPQFGQFGGQGNPYGQPQQHQPNMMFGGPAPPHLQQQQQQQFGALHQQFGGLNMGGGIPPQQQQQQQQPAVSQAGFSMMPSRPPQTAANAGAFANTMANNLWQ